MARKCPYLGPQWESLRYRKGYSQNRVIRRYQRRRQFALRLVDHKLSMSQRLRNIARNRLDNPYSSPEAYRFMLSISIAGQSQKGLQSEKGSS